MDGAHFAQSIHKCSELSSSKDSALIFKFMHVHVLHIRRDSSLSVKQFYNELEQVLAKLLDELKMKVRRSVVADGVRVQLDNEV